MKKLCISLSLFLLMLGSLILNSAVPAEAASAPTKLWVEPSDTNGIPAQIDVFKMRTGGTNTNPTYTYQLYLPGNVNAGNCTLSWNDDAQATVDGKSYDSGSCPIPPVNTQKTVSFKNGNQTLEHYWKRAE